MPSNGSGFYTRALLEGSITPERVWEDSSDSVSARARLRGHLRLR